MRFTSPHPKDLRPETIAAMVETPNVCNQLHLPLQSGSNRVLAAMRRGYRVERYLEKLSAARAAIADLAVTTDLIVGFPGESDAEFDETLEVVAACEFDLAYTFIFSPREGTRAAEMTDEFVASDVIKERFERLKDVTDRSALAPPPGPGGRARRGAGRGTVAPQRSDALGSHTPRQVDPLSRHRESPARGVARQRGRDLRRAVLLARRVARGAARPASQDSRAASLVVTTLGGPAVALVGATASGKSALAHELALELGDVDIVSVDAMCVYRGMDLATAKPTLVERAEVPYHLLDLVEPSEEFTVAQFQRDARERRPTRSWARAPACCSWAVPDSTGARCSTILEIPGRYPEVRANLDERAQTRPGGLYVELEALDPLAASRLERTNERRVVRALEVTLGSGRPFSSYGEGLHDLWPRSRRSSWARRRARRARRTHRGAISRAGWTTDSSTKCRRCASARGDLVARRARPSGTASCLRHLEEGVPLEECVRDAITQSRRLARRQRSWFRRDPRVEWFQTTRRCRRSPGGGAECRRSAPCET